MIAIIDYGMGNLASVRNALYKLGYPAFITRNKEEVLKAGKVILPGVGAFADAMDNLVSTGMDQVVKQVIAEGTPLLGICLGLQLLFTTSEENGIHKGLDIIKGHVTKLPDGLKIPHMGWNQIEPREDSRLFGGIEPGSFCYFVHSYYVKPDDDTYTAAKTFYATGFTSAVEKGSLFATQFHPEKSGTVGLKILKNFGEI